MKIALIALGLTLAGLAAAWAGTCNTHCYYIGNQQYCNTQCY